MTASQLFPIFPQYVVWDKEEQKDGMEAEWPGQEKQPSKDKNKVYAGSGKVYMGGWDIQPLF